MRREILSDFRGVKIRVLSRQQFGLAQHGGLDHDVVIRVTAGLDVTGRRDEFSQYAQAVDEGSDLLRAPAVAVRDARTSQDVSQFGQQRLAGDEYEAVFLHRQRDLTPTAPLRDGSERRAPRRCCQPSRALRSRARFSRR